MNNDEVLYRETAHYIVEMLLRQAALDIVAYANTNPFDVPPANEQREAIFYARLLLPSAVMNALGQVKALRIALDVSEDERFIFAALPHITDFLGEVVQGNAPSLVIEPPVIPVGNACIPPAQSFVEAVFRGARDYWYAQGECLDEILEVGTKAMMPGIPVHTSALLNAQTVINIIRNHENRDRLLRGMGVKSEALDIDYFTVRGRLHSATAACNLLAMGL